MKTQTYKQGDVVVEFTDKKPNHHSAKCQPRDIDIVSVHKAGKLLRLRERDVTKLEEAIAIDVRHGQGFSDIGIAKGLLYK